MLAMRGVCYDTGSGGSRAVWSVPLMLADLRAIRDDLHCNAVSVYGSDLDRLAGTAAAATELGLQVWLWPRLAGRPREVLDHLAQAARRAEALRAGGASVGLVAGRTAGSVATARANFGGPVTCLAAPSEQVEWGRFDYVALDLRRGLTGQLGEPGRGRPVLVLAGTATNAGAVCRPAASGRGRPRVRVLRDEQAQADHLVRLLGIFTRLGLHGVSIHQFIQPTHPYSIDPSLDLDATSMAIVRTIRENYDDERSPYRWEPKQSFHAVADYFLGFRMA